MKGMQKEEGRMKNGERAVHANGENKRASVLECAGPPALFKAEASPGASNNPYAGRARHSVRAADQPRRTSKFQTRDAILPLLRERAGVRGITAPTSAAGVSYTLNQSILEKIWLERLRQKQLFREGKIFFACDSPVVSDDRKLRVLTEELGEVAGAIDQIEILNPLRQPRAELSEPSARAKNNLREELAQIAAVAIAWLESLQTPASSERGSVSRSTSSATNVLDNPRRQLQEKLLRVTDPRSEVIDSVKEEKP